MGSQLDFDQCTDGPASMSTFENSRYRHSFHFRYSHMHKAAPTTQSAHVCVTA